MSLRVNHLGVLMSQPTDRHDEFPSRASAFGSSAPVLQPRPSLAVLHVGRCCSWSEDAQVLSVNGWGIARQLSGQGFVLLFSVISWRHGFVFSCLKKTLHHWFAKTQTIHLKATYIQVVCHYPTTVNQFILFFLGFGNFWALKLPIFKEIPCSLLFAHCWG